MTIPNIGNKPYSDYDMVFIVNPKQAYLYIKHKAYLYDVICGRDERLVFVFNRVESQPLFDAWCKHELL